MVKAARLLHSGCKHARVAPLRACVCAAAVRYLLRTLHAARASLLECVCAG